MTRLLPLCVLLSAAQAADWPRFRGPNGAGVAVNTTRLPAEIGPGKNVLWKTALPPGHSSPVLFGDRIYLTAAELGTATDAGLNKIVDQGGRLFTYALQRATGEVLWRTEAPRPRLERYQPTNSPASPSPAVDRDGIYVFFGDYGLLAYTHDGKEKWRLPLGPFNNVNGHGSSPIVAGSRVILLCDQDSGSYLIAADKRSGKVAWKIDRPEAIRSYTTPAVYEPARGGGPAELIIPGSYHLASYDAASGKKLWWINGMSWQPKSTPIVDGGLIYAHWWESGGEAEATTQTPSWEETAAKFDANKDGRISREEFAADPRLQRGFENNDLAGDGFLDRRDWDNYAARRGSRNALLAVRPGGRGDVTETHVQWRMQKFLPNVPSPLIYDGVMYLVKDGGIFTSLDPKTGVIHKQGRLTGALDTYYSSPVAGAGKVYLFSQTGKATVLKAGPQWEILSSADMDETVFATPAIADDRIYARTRAALYCFGER